MNAPDMLEVINGPEDGTEFPINRAPVIAGRDPGCAVNVRLDESVQPFHARLTAVSDGYRVRRIGPGTLRVNGRKAGVIRSRILRDGGILCMGRTELYLCCAPDGLARRSRGLPTESDFAWCLRVGGRKIGRALRWGTTASRRRPRFLQLLILAFIVAAVAGYFQPGLLAELLGLLRQSWDYAWNQLVAYTGRPH